MAEIIEIDNESIFDTKCSAMVNTVNCKGVMGKGLALEFRLRYPDMYHEYKMICDNGELKPGDLHVYTKENPIIINFASKDHWKYPSKIKWIISGLQNLSKASKLYGLKSIALPQVGVGNGGLSWDLVKPVIYTNLLPINDLIIHIYIYSNNVKDLLFLSFKEWISNIDFDEFHSIIHFRRVSLAEFEKLQTDLKHSKINSLIQVSNYQGIGKEALKQLYLIAMKSR